MSKILLFDLDGTLTDTSDPLYKPMKDGLEQVDLSKIKLIKGAEEYIKKAKSQGHKVYIISDSHPNYVTKIADEIFHIPSLNLADKPNSIKTLGYLDSQIPERNIDDIFMIGDSWLDIELGRRLNVRTVLTKFYMAKSIEKRDGIGEDWKPIKTGPTYYAYDFNELEDIINNSENNLLCLEAKFKGFDSWKMVKFKYRKNDNGFVAFRALARQNDGECDFYAIADKYFQIGNKSRTPEFISILSQGVENYIRRVEQFPQYNWDYITYVSDKNTTTPKNKMKEIFEKINTFFTKAELFEWKHDIQGSLRDYPDYKKRREFIGTNLFIKDEFNLEGKSIIILDDQFTTSATAYEITNQLKNKGVVNILFVAFFYLILSVESKVCPKCGKPLHIKIKRIDGNKFYSCVTPQFKGNGCGYIESIN